MSKPITQGDSAATLGSVPLIGNVTPEMFHDRLAWMDTFCSSTPHRVHFIVVLKEYRQALAIHVAEGLMCAIGEDIVAFAAQEDVEEAAKPYLLQVAMDLMQSRVESMPDD